MWLPQVLIVPRVTLQSICLVRWINALLPFISSRVGWNLPIKNRAADDTDERFFRSIRGDLTCSTPEQERVYGEKQNVVGLSFRLTLLSQHDLSNTQLASLEFMFGRPTSYRRIGTASRAPLSLT